MTRIFLPSNGREAWRELLADRDRHWQQDKSAFECATAWESAQRSPRGLPTLVATALDSHPSTANAELLVAIPELQVDLPGGGHPSQNDVWALLRGAAGTISLAVEVKSGESLDRLVGEWLADAPSASGKPTRLQFLQHSLGLRGVDVSALRYQLLHRAASALVQAERFGARFAVLLIHSFGGHADDKSREDYQRFAETMGCAPAFNAVVTVGRQATVPLLIGWLTDVPAGSKPAVPPS
ncbi:MAG: DUF6946 family protein [Candidatus Rokuibacteriota bacterium]